MKLNINPNFFSFICHWNEKDRKIAAISLHHECLKYFKSNHKIKLNINNEDILQTAILSILEEYQKKGKELLSKTIVYLVRRKLNREYANPETLKAKCKISSLEIEYDEFSEVNRDFCTFEVEVEYENTIKTLKNNLSGKTFLIFEMLCEQGLSQKEIQEELKLSKIGMFRHKAKIKKIYNQLFPV